MNMSEILVDTGYVAGIFAGIALTGRFVIPSIIKALQGRNGKNNSANELNQISENCKNHIEATNQLGNTLITISEQLRENSKVHQIQMQKSEKQTEALIKITTILDNINRRN